MRCASAGWRRPRATTPRAGSARARRWATRPRTWSLVAIRGTRSRARSSGWRAAPSCSPASRARTRRCRAHAWRSSCRTGLSSSSTRAASPRGGGSSARSSERRAHPAEPGASQATARAACYHRLIPAAFASTEELTPEPTRSMPEPSRLAEEVALPGKAGKALEALGIQTVGDLIEHLPREHVEREARKVADLRRGEKAAVAVQIRSVSVRPMRNRRQKRVDAKVADESGPMLATWFNRPWVADQLAEGAAVLLVGTRKDRNQFWVDEFEVLNGGGAAPGTGRVPLYPATAGISAQQLRKLVWEHREELRNVVEPLPSQLRVAEGLPDRHAALFGIHFPEEEHEEVAARRRLAFEELLLLQLALAGRRRARGEARRAAALEARGELVDPWVESLPFSLTGDQRAAVAAI